MTRHSGIRIVVKPLIIVTELLFLIIISSILSCASEVAAPAAASGQKLLQKPDLVYLGAFRVPDGQYGCPYDDKCSFHYGGGPIGYNPANNSLFIAGHRHNQWIAEINIPAAVSSTTLLSLNTATIRQDFYDLSNGSRGNLGAGGAYIENGGQLGGLLSNGAKLLLSDYAYYDGSYKAIYTHFTANADWTANGTGFSGMKTVGVPPAPQAGFVGGYMAKIPPAWQSHLGGTAITGMSNIAIIGRTSMGPSAFAFNPDEVGVVNPVPASALVYYPEGHWTLGTYAEANPNVSKATQITGVVFPDGTKSVLFFGRHGLTACYGPGTGIKAEAERNSGVCGDALLNPGETCCYDPSSLDKGVHGYPYLHQVWAYNADDLLTVKKGVKKPWEILPYAVWNFELPFQTGGKIILGAAYDPARQRIYISQDHGDGNLPVIHLFQILLK